MRGDTDCVENQQLVLSLNQQGRALPPSPSAVLSVAVVMLVSCHGNTYAGAGNSNW